MESVEFFRGVEERIQRPLGAILESCESLEGDTNTLQDDELREWLQSINHSCNHLFQILDGWYAEWKQNLIAEIQNPDTHYQIKLYASNLRCEALAPIGGIHGLAGLILKEKRLNEFQQAAVTKIYAEAQLAWEALGDFLEPVSKSH